MMKLNRNSLVTVLKHLTGLTSSSKGLPILSCVLIKPEHGYVSLSASDLDRYLNINLSGEINSGSAFALPAQLLLKICQSLTDDSVTLQNLGKGRVVLNSGASKFTLNGLPGEEFPHFPKAEEPTALLRCSGQSLADLLGMTKPFESTDRERVILSGTNLTVSGKQLVAAATDGRRLAVARMDLETPVSSTPISCNLGSRTTDLLPRLLLDGTSAEIRISPSDSPKALWVDVTPDPKKMPDVKSVSALFRTVPGAYPDYNRIVPKPVGFVTVMREDMISALERINAAIDKQNCTVCLSFTNDCVSLKACEKTDDAQDSVPLVSGSEPFKLAINGRFLIDALRVCKTDKLPIGLIDENSPILIKEGERYHSVIMPVRVC